MLKAAASIPFIIKTQTTATPHPAPSQALASADVLLVAAGAGFSADCGLPVYDSIAADPLYASAGITYSDLCSPLMMVEHPDLFFGFWGLCCNMYRAAPLHAGYDFEPFPLCIFVTLCPDTRC